MSLGSSSNSVQQDQTSKTGPILQPAETKLLPSVQKHLDMFCILNFGEQEKKSDNFQQCAKDTQSQEDINFHSRVWQGRLRDCHFPFEMELDDEQIQLRSLDIKVCESGESSEASLGLVQIDLSPLLFKENAQPCEGWFPIYSVDKGITGELYISIQIKYEADLSNELHAHYHQQQTKQISFFSSKAPPYYEVRKIIGFVEELVDFKLEKTEKDQLALQESVLRLRRRLGEIVKKKNGNSIITYRQSIEHTGDYAKRIVLRGYGTAALVEIDQQAQLQMLESQQLVTSQSPKLLKPVHSSSLINSQAASLLKPSLSLLNPELVGASSVNVFSQAEQHFIQNNSAPALVDALYRGTTPQMDGQQKQKIQLITTDTMPGGEHEQKYSIRFGCAVSARAVRKLSNHHVYEQAQKTKQTSKIASEWNQWWGELRSEINKSAKQLNCTHVLGYRESVTIHNSMCIFTAFGTAVRATVASQKKYSMNQFARYYKMTSNTSKNDGKNASKANSAGKRYAHNVDFSNNVEQEMRQESRFKKKSSFNFDHSPGQINILARNEEAKPTLKNSDKTSDHSSNSATNEVRQIADELKSDVKSCKFCHVILPRKKAKYPQRVDGRVKATKQMSIDQDDFVVGPNLHKCLSCGERYVPEVIIATINPPDGLQIIGTPQLIEARAIKIKKTKSKSTRHQEQDLMAFSEQIFLIEYTLHNQLMNKLKLAGKNALFCYRTSIRVNSTSITGLAMGTAVCLQALPLCKPIKIVPSRHLYQDLGKSDQDSDDHEMSEVFSMIESLSRFNIRRMMEQSIVSIQSPYTYMRDLPKKRVIENLMTMAEQQQTQIGMPQSSESNPDQVKINVRLNNQLNLSAIPENHLEGKALTPCEAKDASSFHVAGPIHDKQLNKMDQINSALALNDISCEINTSIDEETKRGATESANKALPIKDEERLIVLVKNLKADSPPQRLDLAGLKPDSLQDTDCGEIPKLRIRSGSLSEKRDMEILLGAGAINSQHPFSKHDSPAVLVIRSKKHSLDAHEVSNQLEAETYKLQGNKQGSATWTRETLLKETQSKQINRRGHKTLANFNLSTLIPTTAFNGAAQSQSSYFEDIEAMVQFYNQNSNFQLSSNASVTPLLRQQKSQQSPFQQDSRLLVQRSTHKLAPITNLMSLSLPTVDAKNQKEGVITQNILKVSPRKVFDNCSLQMILQINDTNDVQSLRSLVDPIMPPNIVFLSSYYDLVNYNFQKLQSFKDVQFYARMFRLKMHSTDDQCESTFTNNSAHKNQNAKWKDVSSQQASLHQNEFNRVMQTAYMELAADLTKKNLTPCVVCSLRTNETVHDDNTVDVFITCSILKTKEDQPHFFIKRNQEDALAFEQAKLNLPDNLVNWYTPACDKSLVIEPADHNPTAQQVNNPSVGNQQDAQQIQIIQAQKAAQQQVRKSAKNQSRSPKRGFFSFLFNLKSKQPRPQYQEYSHSYRYGSLRNVSADESIRLLPMSIYPGMNIRENFGLVDVHLIRCVYLPVEESPVQKGGQPNIELVVEDVVADLNEIVRTRVRSLGGNCLIGYKISFNGFEQVTEENKVNLIMSAIGDAVLLEEQKTLLQSSSVSENSDRINMLKHSEFCLDEEQKLQSNLRINTHNQGL